MSPEARPHARIPIGDPGALPKGARVVEPAGRDAFDTALDRMLARARAAGVAEGSRLSAQRAAGALDGAVQELEEFRRGVVATLSHDAVDLALAIARRLLRAHVPRGDFDLEGMVRETLEVATSERGHCTVHLHPEDLASLEGAAFRSGTRLEGDVGVSRGDVHVETSMGLVVRELDSLLDRIGEGLREELS